MAELRGHVVLFGDANFEGAQKVLFSSSPFIGSQMNDCVSSFVIFEGEWELYCDANWQTSAGTFSPGEYPWVEDVGVPNDAISSLRLVRPTTSSACGCIDVRDFGIIANSEHPQTGHIQQAIDSLDDGMTLCFPPGQFIAEGLVVSERRINIVGAGGRGYIFASDTPTSANGRANISSTTAIVAPIDSKKEVPLISFLRSHASEAATQETLQRWIVDPSQPRVEPHGDPHPSRFSALRNLDLVGRTPASTRANESSIQRGQHGLWVDNLGIDIQSVQVAFCSGHGVLITNSQTGYYSKLWSSYNALDGLRMEPRVHFYYDSKEELHRVREHRGWGVADRPGDLIAWLSLTTNRFDGLSCVGNSVNGIRIRAGAGGVFNGAIVEANMAFGVVLGDDGDSAGESPGAKGNRFIGLWAEQNGRMLEFTAGSDGSDGGRTNFVDFARWEDNEQIVDNNPLHGNQWHGPTGSV